MAEDAKDESNDLVTFMLEGDVSLATFAEALGAFNKLITGLSREAGGEIKWELEDLVYSSAVTVVRGRSTEPERVARVVDDYVDIGRRLQRNERIRRAPNISRPAYTIRRVFQKSPTVKAVRFESDKALAIVSRPPALTETGHLLELFPAIPPTPFVSIGTEEEPYGAYGAVEGIVQTLTNRHGHRFTLFDHINDRAVSCYLDRAREEIMRDAWGKRAVVEGWVIRDPANGNPIAIREVTNVTIIEEEGDYTQARGILPLQPGDPLPEETIRRLRDG